MKKICMTALLALFGWGCAMAEGEFDKYFQDKTMRFDYYHAGTATEEHFYFDKLKEEPYFAGSKVSLIDNSGYGNLQYRLIDKETGTLIYQRNYCTLWSEWSTTPEAKTLTKAMPEGITFPFPKKACTLEIYSRDKKNVMHKRFSQDIDPTSYAIEKFAAKYETFDVAYTGESSHRMDIVLIPEGYSEADKAKFEDACKRFANALFAFTPFKENKYRINIRAVWAPSAESGVTIPGEHIWKQTACKAKFYTFDSERYQMITDEHNLMDIAAHAPYDYIYVLSNTQKYGGGAIYNFYGISAAHHPTSTDKVFVHEFGHLMLGLGDEYVGGSDTEMYDSAVEPWEANLTTLNDFETNKPYWAGLAKKDKSSLPTTNPEKSKNMAEWKGNTHTWKVGAYEGGGYLEKGVYRPMPNCMMNWLHTIDEFCPVCIKAIQDYMDFLCK